MNRERANKVEEVFQAALDAPTGRRAALLEEACAGDAELRREVESLLEAHDRAGDFIEDAPGDVAARVLAEGGGRIEAGSPVGRYTIVGPLGTGGMGEVYIATDALGRRVALKLLSARLSDDPQSVARFGREAQAVLALNHPNIVTVYDIGRAGPDHYIASELIEGETLRARMGRAEVGMHESLDLTIQVAAALAAAHEKGVVHRDVKPENVMIRPDGYVKVLDFGIAKLTDAHAGLHAQEDAPTRPKVETARGTVIGTPHYMSPEQARGLAVDERTDVWSLGVVLYEMVAGRQPFDGETTQDVISAVLERQPQPLARYARGVPDALEWLVAKALRKEREGRYQSAREMLSDLRELRKRLEFEAERERRDSLESEAALDAGPTGGGEARDTGLQPVTPTGDTIGRGTSPDTGSGERPQAERSGRAGRAALLVVAALFVSALAAGVYLYFAGGQGAVGSVAVLPLVNEGGDPETEYLSDGITESLINDLSRLSSLRVMARSTAFRYKGREADPQAVGRELGVDAVLTGRVVQRGDSLVVQADLVKVSDGTQLWGERFNRRLADALAVQEEISREIVERLRPRLSGEERSLLAKRQTGNDEAYRLYLKGRYYWYKNRPEEFLKSRDFFQRAIDLDPTYALAHAGLADFYGYATAVLGLMRPEEAWPRLEAATRKTLELDPTLAETHNALAALRRYYYRDWPGAEAEFKRAIELNPNYAEAHHHYAINLFLAGRQDEAAAEVDRALEIDPLSLRFNRNKGRIFYGLRRYDRAEEQYRRTLDIDPNDPLTHEALAQLYMQQGRRGEALAAWRRAMTAAGDRELAAIIESSEAEAGYDAAVRAVGRKRLERLEGKAKRGDYTRAIDFVNAYVLMGDGERAIEWLGRAAEERNNGIFDAAVNPFYDPLRTDPRFAEIMRKIGMPG